MEMRGVVVAYFRTQWKAEADTGTRNSYSGAYFWTHSWTQWQTCTKAHS
jgi:hypothetical protein